MASKDPKKHMIELLSATGYGLKLKPDQLSLYEKDAKMKQFWDWFCNSISKENCLTKDELEEFKKLEDSGEVLYGDELEEALKVHSSESSNSLSETVLEVKKEELTFREDQLETLTQLLSSTKESVSALNEDICKLQAEQREAEARNTACVVNAMNLSESFDKKIAKLRDTMSYLREWISGLVQKEEISKDEGIDTLASDNFDTSSISSVTSSVTLESKLNAKFICQLPFDKYEKIDQKLIKVIDKLFKKQAPFNKGDSLEIDLELQSILDRLTELKKTSILHSAEIESLKEAQEKVHQIKSEIRRGRAKVMLENIRCEVAESLEQSDAEESFLQELHEMNEVCREWAAGQLLNPVIKILKSRDYEALNNQLDEVQKDLQLKITTDKVLCAFLNFEGEKVETFISIHRKLENKIKEWSMNTRKRIETMKENLQDYQDYMSLPIEERCVQIQWIASMLGIEAKEIAEGVKELDSILRYYHESLTNNFQNQMQMLLNEDQRLNEVYANEFQNCRPVKTNESIDTFNNIHTMLDVMRDEILESVTELNCQADGFNVEEENKVEEMIQERIQQMKINDE